MTQKVKSILASAAGMLLAAAMAVASVLLNAYSHTKNSEEFNLPLDRELSSASEVVLDYPGFIKKRWRTREVTNVDFRVLEGESGTRFESNGFGPEEPLIQKSVVGRDIYNGVPCKLWFLRQPGPHLWKLRMHIHYQEFINVGCFRIKVLEKREVWTTEELKPRMRSERE